MGTPTDIFSQAITIKKKTNKSKCMNDLFNGMVRRALMGGFSLAIIYGGFTACTDDYDLDDEGNYPSWMGGSIYQTLKDPSSLQSSGRQMLTGTFNNYLRLIDDLGETETMNKTGSRTIFPANDEAFARFFADNAWGVSSYEDLTRTQKRQLLYTSMLENALLVEMLSNVSRDATSVTQGQAIKHSTAANVIDAITFLQKKEEMPANNSFWEKYYDKGIHIVSDATTSNMIHFTKEYLLNNGITIVGEDGKPSDFEVLTGSPFDDSQNTAYIFRNKIISPDITCKNGYIHQMQDVVVPPGNMAEIIHNSGESNLFSRMLERFSIPYLDQTVTKNYNDYAVVYGEATIDSIFEKRYVSERSHGGILNKAPTDNPGAINATLTYDPGWNNYNDGTTGSDIANMATMFVPTDKALSAFFLPGGQGEFLITQFGKLPNTEENLAQNIDSIPMDNISAIINNLMQPSFKGSVPSKFNNVMDEAMDPMGLSLDVLNKNSDNTYDVKIANNGAVYMLNTMFAPPSLICVAAPVKLSDDMRVMREAVYDGDAHKDLALNQNFYVYLLAMSANYAFFIPTDAAFEQYYIDPMYLNEDQPRALKFTPLGKSPYIQCEAYKYDPTTGDIGELIGEVKKAEFQSLLVDILNYHTVVLGHGETMGTRKYYKTKHGGTISIDFATDSLAMAGQQVNYNMNGYIPRPASKITKTFNQANGKSYAIDHVIQAPFESVYHVLKNTESNGSKSFSEFFDLCTNRDMDDILRFASDKMTQTNSSGNMNSMAYHPFINGGVDMNVNYFKSYNYTVYAPDNTAMNEAYSLGLPRWSDIKVLYDTYNDTLQAINAGAETTDAFKAELQAARDKALAMAEEINDFVRYHFQDNSVYADVTVDGGDYPTASSDTLGLSQTLHISGGGGTFTIKDRRGQTISVNANDDTKLVNKMTRDYVFNTTTDDKNVKTKKLSTSSFAAIHQISHPLNAHANGRYDSMWTGAGARKRLANYRRLWETTLYKRYQGN